MAFSNEHAARIRRPGDFKAGSFKRHNIKSSVATNGKVFGVIKGNLENGGEEAKQALRYPVADWTEAQARKHAEGLDAILFESAEPQGKKSKNHVVFQMDYERKAELPSSLFWSIEDSAVKILPSAT